MPEAVEDFHDYKWVLECEYDGPDHIFPKDWFFGGTDGSDPRADTRWLPTTYQYFDDRLDLIHTTQTPMCDDQAIDEFSKGSFVRAGLPSQVPCGSATG